MSKLQGILKHKGKLILISKTENAYFVHKALCNGLCKYCGWKVVNLGVFEPPLCAMQNQNDKFWQGSIAESAICELVRILDGYSPQGFYFHRPIFGIVLNWGWFRKPIKLNHGKQNQVFEI